MTNHITLTGQPAFTVRYELNISISYTQLVLQMVTLGFLSEETLQLMLLQLHVG